MGVESLPYWAKVLPIAIFGFVAFALMQSAEFARQDYELNVCTNADDQCLYGSASSSSLLAEASIAVVLMGLCAIFANAMAPPKVSHMKAAFVPYHFVMVHVWYLFCWAITLVPLIYTIYLLVQQGGNTGVSLYSPTPTVSDLLTSLAICDEGTGECTSSNPCNPNNVYCASIVPGLLAGFGYLFAGATAFWSAWLVMDDTAHKILRGEEIDSKHGMDGAYFSAVPSAEMAQPRGEAPHISQVR